MISHNVATFFAAVLLPSNNEHFRVTHEQTTAPPLRTDMTAAADRQKRDPTTKMGDRPQQRREGGREGARLFRMTKMKKGKEGSVTSGADFAASLTHSTRTRTTTTMMIRAKCSVV